MPFDACIRLEEVKAQTGRDKTGQLRSAKTGKTEQRERANWIKGLNQRKKEGTQRGGGRMHLDP